MFTQCPQCGTVFSVGDEQLDAAGGRVRCGACRAPFDALLYLVRQLPAGSARAAPGKRPRPPAAGAGRAAPAAPPPPEPLPIPAAPARPRDGALAKPEAVPDPPLRPAPSPAAREPAVPVPEP
nr:zinc-ribbon domain-containing protein [Gammaproteobacteria bacterium]